MEYRSITKRELESSVNQIRLSPGKALPLQVLDIIGSFLYNVQYGVLIVVIQDGIVIKIEQTEKFVITAKSRDRKHVIEALPAKLHPLQDKIVAEIQTLMYGQLIIRMDNGQVNQIEKTEKKRPHEIEGSNGDGI
jgi:hypothetical protein